MLDKKQIIRDYKNSEPPKGVFIIKNNANGRFLLGSTLNLNGWQNKHIFTLKMGNHSNSALQADWKELGTENFTFEILEQLDVVSEAGHNYAYDLEILEMIWVDKLNPAGELGYNKNDNIRQA